MSSTVATLRSAMVYINIYFGLSIGIAGVIGGFLNIIIFTTLKTFRETTCATYLIAAAIHSLGASLTVFIRVYSARFDYSSLNSALGCKFRTFLSQYFALVVDTCMSIAVIDQFLSMTRYRYWNTIRSAVYQVTFTCFFWFIYCIFIFIYYNSNGTICIVINTIYEKYFSYIHLPVIFGFLPLTIMSIGILLTLYKIVTKANQQTNIARLSRDRQLTAMTFTQNIFMIVLIVPSIIVYIYALLNSGANISEATRLQFISTITTLLGYAAYACPFYVYCCASKRFRKQVSHVLIRVHLNRCKRQIHPLLNNN